MAAFCTEFEFYLNQVSKILFISIHRNGMGCVWFKSFVPCEYWRDFEVSWTGFWLLLWMMMLIRVYSGNTGAWYCRRKKYTSMQYRKQESYFEGQYCIVCYLCRLISVLIFWVCSSCSKFIWIKREINITFWSCFSYIFVLFFVLGGERYKIWEKIPIYP